MNMRLKQLCLGIMALGMVLPAWAQQARLPFAVTESRMDAHGKPSFLRIQEGNRPSVQSIPQVLRTIYGLGTMDDLAFKSEKTDAIGYVHRTYQQMHDGKPVLGGVVKAHCMHGEVVSISGQYMPVTATGKARITSDEALAVAIRQTGAKKLIWQMEGQDAMLKRLNSNPQATWRPEGELTYVQDHQGGTKTIRLAWKLDVYSVDPLFREDVYIDAETGALLFRNPILSTADANGVGHSRYSGVRSIVTDSLSPNSFRLRETGRAQGVETFNMLNQTDYQAAVDFVDSNNVWDIFQNPTDNSAIDAHWGAEMTFDYFMLFHNRNSFDDAGGKLVSFVHYDNQYSNAFWNGMFMTYGDGGNNNNPFQGLDVCGHEFSHGLTQHTAGLVYQDEPGALNESFSDIFGNSIEFWARPNDATWRIGDDIGAFRSMSDPPAYQNPDTYHGSFWATGAWDNGGVHTNSGVQNHWYYLLSDGGSGTNDNGDAYNVTGIGIDSAAAIAYRNLNVYLSPYSQYADARYYSIQAAIDLFGECSPQMIQTMNAWHAVGVGLPYTGTLEASFFTPDSNQCYAPVLVEFTNLSTSAIHYLWDFGDGNTSTDENPDHTYLFTGDYTVTLIAYGCNGATDTIVFPNRIHIDPNQPCTINMPSGNDSLMQTACDGNLYDSGGSSDYLNNSNSRVTIQPGGNNQVQLTFTAFNFAAGDRITIYDGPYLSSPQIGIYSGTALPPTITSTSGALTLKESTNGANVREGFTAYWSCLVGTEEANGPTDCKVYPNPTTGTVNLQWRNVEGSENEIAVYDALGRMVLHRQGTHQGDWNTTIHLTGMPSGIYTLQLKAGEAAAVRRLIVQ